MCTSVVSNENNVHVPVSQIPMLREWKQDDNTGTTPVAVPVYPSTIMPLGCHTYPVYREIVATAVTNLSRRLSDQWQNYQEDHPQEYYVEQHQHQNHNHHENGVDPTIEEDWEFIEQSGEIHVIHGELVEVSTEASVVRLNEPSSPSSSPKNSFSLRRRPKIFWKLNNNNSRRRSRRKRKGCDAAFRDWIGKQKGRLSSTKNNAKQPRKSYFFNINRKSQGEEEEEEEPIAKVASVQLNRHQGEDPQTFLTNRSLDSALIPKSFKNHQHQQCLTDRSIDDVLESIRIKIEQEESLFSSSSQKREEQSNIHEGQERNNQDDSSESSDREGLTTTTTESRLDEEETRRTSAAPEYRSIRMNVSKVIEHKENRRQIHDVNDDPALTEKDTTVSTCYNAKKTKQLTRVIPFSSSSSLSSLEDAKQKKIVVNDTLKVVFVGNGLSSSSSSQEKQQQNIIGRLCGREKKFTKNFRSSTTTTTNDRLVNVDIFEWDPAVTVDSSADESRDKEESSLNGDEESSSSLFIDTEIDIKVSASLKTDQDVIDLKCSVWDFTGSHPASHATQELFFSPKALYVIMWDMSKTWEQLHKSKSCSHNNNGEIFTLEDDSDNDDEDFFLCSTTNTNIVENLSALQNDIDENVQFWVDCIQRNAPGSAIIPVGTFASDSDNNNNTQQKRRRKRTYEIMKERLMNHEERMVSGFCERVVEHMFASSKSNAAQSFLHTLYQLRPKVIFDERNSLDVNSVDQRRLDHLRQTIVQIATGRCSAHHNHRLLFSRHIGEKIPYIWLQVRDLIRELRKKKYFFVESNLFYDQLKARGIDDKVEIINALHFLLSVGEVTYYGKRKYDANDADDIKNIIASILRNSDSRDCYGKKSDNFAPFCSHVNFSTSTKKYLSNKKPELPQFLFLNPKWLMKAITCILRHDLAAQIYMHRFSSQKRSLMQCERYLDNKAYPHISSADICLLWEKNAVVKKATDLIIKNTTPEKNKVTTTPPFEYLQRVLVQYNVLVPTNNHHQIQKNSFALLPPNQQPQYFLPSLLQSIEPDDNFFTYKKNELSKTTLCNSWLFPDGFPHGMMEKIMATALQAIFIAEKKTQQQDEFRITEIICWRNSFYFHINEVKIFVRIAEKMSPLCVASKTMCPGMKRLTISGQGNSLCAGNFIWNGGYGAVMKAIQNVLKGYSVLDYQEQVICPSCLKQYSITEACCWDNTQVQKAVKKCQRQINCGNGHRVETPLISGSFLKDAKQQQHYQRRDDVLSEFDNTTVKMKDLLGGFVLVGVYDSTTGEIISAGSGFIADKDRGLIITAAHTVMNIRGENLGREFGDKIVIGVIPHNVGKKATTTKNNEVDEPSPAVFRYMAKVVVKDPSIVKNKVCRIDACVLKIITKLETDVEDSRLIHKVHHIPMTKTLLKQEKNLRELKIRNECEVEERVRIVGFSQGGEDIINEGEWLFRNIGCTPGVVICHFPYDISLKEFSFRPKKEIILDCDSIVGESGGPCINQQGEVIGVLSRGHPTRCYLVPTSEWSRLLEQAKRKRPKRKLLTSRARQ